MKKPKREKLNPFVAPLAIRVLRILQKQGRVTLRSTALGKRAAQKR